MTAPKRRWFQLSLRGLFGAAAIAAILAWAFQPVRFDGKEWKAARPNSTHRTARSSMVDDLLRQYDFHGWTRQEVIELLGDGQPGAGTGFDQWDLIYILGLERAGPFSLDDEALGFKFDKRGCVVAYGTSVN